MKKLLALLCLINVACVQRKYSEPSGNYSDPGILYYKTIAELRADMGVAGAKEIKQNIMIAGTVIADDRNGNFYKQIIIDDGTAAMPVLLDAYNLYNDFPLGRKVYIKCKGLFTNYYYKLPQLGFSPDTQGSVSPIPFHLWGQFITTANDGNSIKPIAVSMADAKKARPELYNRLVSISDVQFMDSTALQYALPATLASATNLKLMDCDSNTISLRSSGYCSFQSARPPRGKGSITVIYTVYNSTPQLVLRDTADVLMTNPRCF